MKTIFELFNAKEISAFWQATASERIPYLGETLFPAKKQLGLDLKWIKGSKGLPVALLPSAFDTKATIRDRIGVKGLETEMPFFKEGMLIKEKDRQELNKAKAAANADFLQPIIDHIYDDQTNLIAGALVNPERMRMQLLSSGAIAISANRIDYIYDYKFPAAHKETLINTARWSDVDNSKPVEDITRWQDTVEDDTGIRPAKAVCSRKTWNYLLRNKSIKLDMNPAGGQNIILTDTNLRAYLLDKCGIQVAVYTKKWSDGTASHQFFPDDVFTLIPDGDLGNTYFGTTPEESDLMAGSNVADVQIVETGIAVKTIKIADPVNVETVVSEIVLPSWETIDQTFIATVA